MAINDADNIGLEDFSEVISDKYAYYPRNNDTVRDGV